jgi:hypothetical protein
MPTIDLSDYRHRFSVVASAVAIVCTIFVARSLLARPQIGADHEVFKAVDALFTAINSKDQQRVDDCQIRLQEFRRAGKLPAPAARRLESIIAQAEKGHWQASAKTLYDFMLAQRGL